LILYRKAPALRVKRVAAPDPPFWYATAIAPYSARRAQPIAIDYVDLLATSAERMEVTVCDRVRDELSRATRLREPLLIEAAELAEEIFARGAEACEFCIDFDIPALLLTSTRGALPRFVCDLVIVAWPADIGRLDVMFAEASERRARWGAAVPLIFPATTDLVVLAAVADLAKKHGAAFFAPIPVELDPAAKQSIATHFALEEETYELLFHADLDPMRIATERHVAALAHERGMGDFIPPPRWNDRTNWNGAVLLTLTSSRMMAMDHEPEIAGMLARSARAVAELDKPIARIAEAASLSIVETLDEISVDLLTEWLSGSTPAFVERINRAWRLRRDAGLSDASL
jgi:hypothetical protein